MALARLRRNQEVDSALAALRRIKTSHAKRNVHFIAGFQHRLAGRYDEAEAEFRKAYKFGRSNFHALRELANVLIVKDRFSEAEAFARSAYEIAPTNPYIIDALCAVLIGMHVSAAGLEGDVEIAELLRELEIRDKQVGKSFHVTRRAEFMAKMGRHVEALKILEGAGSDGLASHFYNVSIRARIRLEAGDLRSFQADLAELRKLLRQQEGTGEEIPAFRLQALEVRFQIRLNNLSAAEDLLSSYRGFPKSVFEDLQAELSLSRVRNR